RRHTISDRDWSSDVCSSDLRDNLAAFASRRGFTLVEHDVTEYIRLDGHLDWVLHFASPASPRDYLELPIQTLKVGALGTHNALRSEERRVGKECRSR